jgi:hypothetical protein
MNKRDEEQDGFDRMLEMQDRIEREAIDRQKRLLMKLNRADLLCLAKHYEIKDAHYYAEPGDWRFGGKEELAGEIAERMMDLGR